jgi:hypothetical protein
MTSALWTLLLQLIPRTRASMKGAKETHILTAIIMVALLMCLLSIAKADEGEGQSSSAVSSQSEQYRDQQAPEQYRDQQAPAVCPGEGANMLKYGWLITFKNACPTDTISVAIRYKTAGAWRAVGYWTLKPGDQVPVALTDNRYFAFFAKSITSTRTWPGDKSSWFKPCNGDVVVGGQKKITNNNYGPYLYNFWC